MKEKILALLIAKFSGVRKDVLNHLARTFALQATNDEEAKALVDKLTDAQVNEYVKEFRAEVDKEVSESNKTFEANLKKKYDFVDKGKRDEPGDPKPNPNNLSEIVKAAVAEAVKPFQEKLSGYEADNIAKSRLQALTEKLNECKDETFKAQTFKDFARMKFDTDDEFNEYLNEKVTDIATANQNMADIDLSNSGGSPLFAQKEESGISKGVADFINSQKPENNVFTGKDV